MKLHLGCGKKLLPGFLNVDLYEAGADARWDICKPWPLEDGSVDYIMIHAVMEHLLWRDVRCVLDEVRRTLLVGGMLDIKVPHYCGIIATGPCHVSQWSEWTFANIEDGKWHQDVSTFQPGLFRRINYRAIYAARGKEIRTPWSWFASRYPRLCQQIGVLPPTSIRWIGEKSAAG